MFKAASRLMLSLAVAAGLAFSALPAQANADADISTRAFTNRVLTVYNGPGGDALAVGVLPGGYRVAVDRCSRLWCNVHVGRHHGWVWLYALSFGAGPHTIYVPSQWTYHWW